MILFIMSEYFIAKVQINGKNRKEKTYKKNPNREDCNYEDTVGLNTNSKREIIQCSKVNTITATRKKNTFQFASDSANSNDIEKKQHIRKEMWKPTHGQVTVQRTTVLA